MSSMKRWLDADSGSSDLERAVLRADATPRIPPGAREQGWERLSAALAGSAVVMTAAKPAAASAAAGTAATAGSKGLLSSVASFGFVKGVAVGVLGCVLVQGGASWLRASSEQPAAPSSSAAPVVPQVLLTSPLVSSTRSSEVSAEPEAIPSQPRRDLAVPRASGAGAAEKAAPVATSAADFEPEAGGTASSLAKEAALLRRARSELYAGDAAAALGTLELARRAVRLPQLTPEREALVIEALYRSGRRAEANRLAREYLARFPDSPHGSKLRALLSEAP